MMIITPHLNFRGQARAALDLYQTVFGGEQVLVTHGQMGQDSGEDVERIMWDEVSAADGFRIMAFDVLEPRPYDPGINAFFVSFQGGSVGEVRVRWDALAEGASVFQPIGRSAWSELYGMLTDRFGITWIVAIRHDAH